MFWDKVAWVYDTFADVINRKANKKIRKFVPSWRHKSLLQTRCWNVPQICPGCGHM